MWRLVSNINNLTSKILKDAEGKRDSIINQAKAEGEAIVSKNVKRAETISNEIIEKANTESEVRRARVISNAKLTVRNNQLQAKQEVIGKVFETAISRLNNLSREEYTTFVEATLKSLDLDGTETIIINEKDKDVFNIKFLTDLNKELMAQGKKGEISLNTSGTFNGGFVLDRNGIQINNTFGSLVNSLRSELEFEVTKALFN